MKLVAEFRSITTPYTFLELDVQKMTITRHHYDFIPDEEDNLKKGPKLRAVKRDRLAHENAARYLGVLEHSKQATALFGLIYSKLDRQNISPDTLEVAMQTKGTKRPVKVSLIQYIAELVDDQTALPPASGNNQVSCVREDPARTPPCLCHK